MDFLLEAFLWKPVKTAGRRMDFLTTPLGMVLSFLVAGFGFGFVFINSNPLDGYTPVISPLLALVGLIMVIKAFTERQNPIRSWTMVMLNHAFIAAAVSVTDKFDLEHLFLYLSGVFICWFIGIYSLVYLQNKEKNITLNSFQGHVYNHRGLALIFLVACLGLSGFPITTTFIGEDLIFHHIDSNHLWMAVFVSFSYVLDGLAIARIYSRVFLGPHMNADHEVANRSA